MLPPPAAVWATPRPHLPVGWDIAQSQSRTLAAGVVLTSYRLDTSAGPVHAWCLAVTPSQARVLPVAAEEIPGPSPELGGHAPRLLSVGRLAQAAGAIAAVNGGFFSPLYKIPVGLLEVNGKTLSGPLFGRAAIALSGGAPRIDRIELQPWIALPDGESAEVDFLNFPQQADALMLYTDAWGERSQTRLQPGSFEVAAAADGTIVSMGGSNLAIPANGFVLAGTGAHGRWLAAHVHLGEAVALHGGLDDYWGDHADVVGGGPILVKDGRASVGQERFPADIMAGRNARTAVGLKPDGTVLLLAVAGGNPSYSVGLTLDSLSHVLVALGAQDAMNLDGGSSTTMWAAGKTINLPADDLQRPVADALVVLPVQEAPQARRASLTGLSTKLQSSGQ